MMSTRNINREEDIGQRYLISNKNAKAGTIFLKNVDAASKNAVLSGRFLILEVLVAF